MLNTISEEKGTLKSRLTATLIAAAVALVICVAAYIMMLMRISNMHIVFPLALGLSFLLIVYMALWTLGANERYRRLSVILKRCYLICFAIGVVWFIIMQAFIISGSRTDGADADVIIVLGAGLRNGAPSLVLAARLDTTVEYLRVNGDIPVIVTGGLGQGETITEAEAMFRYLVARGIDESLIWKEDKSTRTHENIAFSRSLMEEKGLDVSSIKVAVVSNEFHLYRAKLIAEKAGLDVSGIAADTIGLHRRVLYHFREAFSLMREFMS